MRSERRPLQNRVELNRQLLPILRAELRRGSRAFIENGSGRLYLSRLEDEGSDAWQRDVTDLLWQGFSLRPVFDEQGTAIMVEVTGYQDPRFSRRRDVSPHVVPVGWREHNNPQTSLYTHVQAKRAAWLHAETNTHLVYAWTDKSWHVLVNNSEGNFDLVVPGEHNKFKPPFDQALQVALQSEADRLPAIA
jgi:hypothetical protein